MSESLDLTGLVETVVRPLLEYPDDLELSSSEDEGVVRIDIRVNNDDLGKVIGRQGRVIKSIRTLTRAAASRHEMRVDVEIIDDERE